MTEVYTGSQVAGEGFQREKDPEQGKTVSMVTVGAGSCPIRVSSWSHFLKLEGTPELPRERIWSEIKYFHGVVQATLSQPSEFLTAAGNLSPWGGHC